MTDDAIEIAKALPQRRGWIQWFAALGMFLAFFAFSALGIWQIERLQWKLALIQHVNDRVGAPAVDAPGPETWPAFNAAHEEYRHVRLNGRLLYDHSTLVTATTELGQGFWVLTPLCSNDGYIRLVNLGFISSEAAKKTLSDMQNQSVSLCHVDSHNVSALVLLTGLLRPSEPHGGFLRLNDPFHDRWYSRDISAIAAARKLHQVAPYFVDADREATDAISKTDTVPASFEHPVGGLTVISFHNNHLVYALTWFGLALMIAFVGFKIIYARRHGKTAWQ